MSNVFEKSDEMNDDGEDGDEVVEDDIESSKSDSENL
jgi:hypothetical protein